MICKHMCNSSAGVFQWIGEMHHRFSVMHFLLAMHEHVFYHRARGGRAGPMMFRENDIAYIVENHMCVTKVRVMRVSGSLCTVTPGEGGYAGALKAPVRCFGNHLSG